MTNVDHDVLIATLDRLKLTASRDQLDTLLDEAARSKMTLREALAFLYRARLPGATSGGYRCRASWRSSRSCANWTASTSRRSPRWIRGRSGSLRPAAGSLTVTPDSSLDRPVQARRIWLWASAARPTRQNYNVQFVTAATLVAMLAKAHNHGSLDKQLTILSRPKLLIIDELGYLPFEANAAHLFFQLVSRRYE
ncbi:IstB-like ATP binding protein [Sinorhizobium meliloti]|nr:IstB-like ATP binding protein [Sinorhizobium meliloti]